MSERDKALAYVRKNLHAWPEGEEDVSVYGDDGELMFEESKYDFYPENCEFFDEDYDFTKDEVFSWEDNTGECPYEEGTLIDVVYRDGQVNLGVEALTGGTGSMEMTAEDWELNGWDSSIIKHRMHVPKMGEEKVTESEQIEQLEDYDWADDFPELTKSSPTAHDIVSAALKHMEDRATTYDKPGGERSMGATVEAFNAVTDGVMDTEEKGWLFMVLLKIVRSQQGDFKLDNYEDGSAYMGLMGEAAAKERSRK